MAGKPSATFGNPRRVGDVAYRADKISKNSWMDLYADLYRQTHGECDEDGEPTSPESILLDAEKRLFVLRVNGIR